MTIDIIQKQSTEISYRTTPEALAEAFLASLDVSSSSRATYTRSLKQYVGWLEETGRHSLQLAREDILTYKDFLHDMKLSAYTVNLYLTAVRKLYQWLESQKIYPDITRGIKGVKKPRGFRKDTLTKEQLRETVDAIDTDSLAGLRDYAIFNLMARTGLRDIEVSGARVGEIRRESGRPVL